MRKAQSAIEYLMTYGWMLLVVAVVGGTIFSLTSGQEPETVSGFTGETVSVENFGLTSDRNFQVSIRNSDVSELQLNSINLTHQGNYVSKQFDQTISGDSSSSVVLPNVSSSEGSNSIDVELSYDRGGLTDITSKGTITGPYVIEGTSDVGGGDGGLQMVDSFESQNLDDYTVNDSEYSITSDQSTDGSYSLVRNGTFNTQRTFSYSGLSTYPESGDTITYDFRDGNTWWGEFSFGAQDLDNRYTVETEVRNNGTLKLIKYDSGSTNELASADNLTLNQDEWYRHEIQWDDPINITLYNGSVPITSIQASDSTYSSGGIGFGTSATDATWWDNVTVR